ncbi:hypothetical protein OHV05_37995 (plasmid) [Kitasatospora sp. NBC_00070]|uniref:hypothetical protein n=1 Tax=Kitasatospora sp. NBC_00070 TaxID=2975962 RepID=UPI002F90AD67
MTSELDTVIVIRLEGPAAAREAVKQHLGADLLLHMSGWFRSIHRGRAATGDPDHEIHWLRAHLTDRVSSHVEYPAEPIGTLWVELGGPDDLVARADALFRKCYWCGPPEGGGALGNDIRFEVDPARSPAG